MENHQSVVVITGTSSGIGFETALLAAKHGYTVIATVRNLKKAEALRTASAGLPVEVMKLDVQDRHSIDRCVEQVLSQYGRIDVWVNNAGFGLAEFLERSSEQSIHEIFDVNVYGPIRCMQAVLPHMRKQKSGHLIAVSSVGGIVGQPMNEVYCSAKFALEGLVESMATYMEPYFGIKMTLIEPAGTKSEFAQRVLGQVEKSDLLTGDHGYAPIAQDYLKSLQENGMFARSQEAKEVAQTIIDCMLGRKTGLRHPTSDFAAAFCVEKLKEDPTGEKQLRRIRQYLLSIQG